MVGRTIRIPKKTWDTFEALRGKNESRQDMLDAAIRREIEHRVQKVEEIRLAKKLGISKIKPSLYFECPTCDNKNYHPLDILNGYCGWCKDWTRKI